MSDREAFRRIWPTSRSDWRGLLGIAGFVLLGVVCVAGLVYAKHRVQEDREKNWDSAVATIEDVRPKLVSQGMAQYGGAMFYEVQVLVRYSVGGRERERWITVEQAPRRLADVQLEAFRWKGQRCLVRWKASEPEAVVAEVH